MVLIIVCPAASFAGKKHSYSPGVSRYDPKSINRIIDNTDLVDDSTSDSDDDAIAAEYPASRRNSAGSLEVMGGADVENGKRWLHNWSEINPEKGMGSSLCFRQVLVITAMVAIIAVSSWAIGYAVMNPNAQSYSPVVVGGEEGGEQHLLEVAERVITACSESKLNEDISECQKLCHSRLCCFESDEYSCEDDESKECAVYAGCEALVEGIPLGAAEEDEQ